MQLDMLWDFMQVDLQADRFEAEMRQSPNRQKLLKDRQFLVDQQNNMKKVEADVASMTERMEALAAEADSLRQKAEALAAEFEGNEPEDREAIEDYMQRTQKLLDQLNRTEQELTKMRKDADTRDRQQKEIRVRAAKTKAEFDQVRVLYDAEFKRDTAKLSELREKAEEESKKIDPALVERYRAIKQHTAVPMAQVNGNQCGGCFMTLSEVALRGLRGGDKLVQCDNCGRILYTKTQAE